MDEPRLVLAVGQRMLDINADVQALSEALGENYARHYSMHEHIHRDLIPKASALQERVRVLEVLAVAAAEWIDLIDGPSWGMYYFDTPMGEEIEPTEKLRRAVEAARALAGTEEGA